MKLNWVLLVALGACVPPGNSTKDDSGTTSTTNVTAAPDYRPSIGVMNTVFEDNFERAAHPGPSLLPTPSASASAAPSASAPALVLGSASAPPGLPPVDELGPNWRQAATNVWHIENGRLCGQHAQNHGVWLNRVLPVNARVEFDAIAENPDGDLKAAIWGDGQSHATQAP